MGLTTEAFLGMELWQFNAFSLAWKMRQKDILAVEYQGAWMTAYWSGSSKHKKSLKSVLRQLYGEPQKKKEPINKQAAEGAFRQFEELQKYGWTKN